MDTIFNEILTSKVYDVAIRTPLDSASKLSRQLNNLVYIKREDMQPIFSFKLRGAYNLIANLTSDQLKRGVICASAGNHAQGVAFSARKVHTHALIVMPVTTPAIKVQAVKELNAEVVLHGESYSDAAEHATMLASQNGANFIHPFDDPLVIAGQGTIGHELIQQLPSLNLLFVPIGGGGLIAGISLFMKRLNPNIRIVGVQPDDSDAMSQSIKQDTRVTLTQVGIFADGVAVKQVGRLTFDIVRKYVDQIITVSTDEISSAVKSIYEETRSIAEPAGALAVAGLKRYVETTNVKGLNLVAINSGANMNFDRLRFVAERALTGEKSEALYAVTIPERPGALKHFCNHFVGTKNITEFNYRMSDISSQTEEANIFVGIGIEDDDERRKFHADLQAGGFMCRDLTDNELAKTHIRHMIGGRRMSTKESELQERIYRFWFPERAGALAHLLNSMSENWNISMFHYHTHGSDFGRVLIGFEIAPSSLERFRRYLQELNYSFVDETDNEAYHLFL